MPAVPCFLIKISKHSIETGGAQVYGLLLPLPFFNFESKIKGTGGGGTSLRSELHLLIIGANILGWEFGRRSTVGNQNWCTETQSCRWTPLFTSLQFKAEIQFLFISFPYQACQAGITIISHAYLYVCHWLDSGPSHCTTLHILRAHPSTLPIRSSYPTHSTPSIVSHPTLPASASEWQCEIAIRLRSGVGGRSSGPSLSSLVLYEILISFTCLYPDEIVFGILRAWDRLIKYIGIIQVGILVYCENAFGIGIIILRGIV